MKNIPTGLLSQYFYLIFGLNILIIFPSHPKATNSTVMSHQAVECHNVGSYRYYFMLCSRTKLASLYRCLTFFLSRHHGGLSLLPQLLAYKNILSFQLKKNGFKGRSSSRSACLQGKYFADLVIPLVKY